MSWPDFKGSQPCLSLRATGRSSVAPSPAGNKSSRLYITVVRAPVGRDGTLPADCFTRWDSCQFSTQAAGKNMCNKLMWFEVKICLIADICLAELHEPNDFYFASVSKSRFWDKSWSRRPYFQSVFIISASRKVGQTQQRLWSVLSKQSHCQVFWGGNVCTAIGCLWVTLFVSRNTDTAALPFPLQTVCLQASVAVPPLVALLGRCCITARSVIVTHQSAVKRGHVFFVAWIQNQLNLSKSDEVAPCLTWQHLSKDKDIYWRRMPRGSVCVCVWTQRNFAKLDGGRCYCLIHCL